jgi:nitrite reductase/ring-hydroxylating ferredoxin subunit
MQKNTSTALVTHIPDKPPTIRVSVKGLGPGQTCVFHFERQSEQLSGFVINHEGRFHTYVNRCPHVTYSLDIGDGSLLDKTGKFLQCSVHGAMFLPESGECFMGPVVGRSLESLPNELHGDELLVQLTDEPHGWPRTKKEIEKYGE